jgi:5''-nucleotidase/2'',3''-cyclic phosphodiesterase and related esterases
VNTLLRLCFAGLLLVAASAARAGSGEVTFIHIGDLHGHLIPRPDLREGDKPGQMVGGLAYMYDEIKKIRKRRPGALLMNTGDTIQGSAEALYTSGEAMVEVLKPFAIDAYVPGNWDYLYGPESFRKMFAGATPEANWHGLAANLYYSTLYEYPATPYAKLAGQRVLPPYMVRVVNGVRVGIIGLTADRGPQAVSTRVTDGLTLTPGEFELRAAIPILRNKYKCDLIVMLSERGLGPNLELADTIPGIDVVLSSDMHEESHHVLIGKHGTLLVEEGQDGTQVGELTVRVVNGKMRSHSFVAHTISTRNNRPDPMIAALIEKIRAPFVKGAAFVPHSNPINGAVLNTPIDTIVGYTETPLHRANFAGSKGDNAVIEGSSHDFLADAFRVSCNADLGIVRGFRYGTHVAGSPSKPGPIRLEDLYHFIPIGPQIACGKASGDQIRLMIERGAASSLSSYVGSWGGGWLTAFSGLSYDLDPSNEAGWRVTHLRVGNAPIDLEKYYTIGGYWYVDNPDRINRAPMLDIRVLRDQDGGVLDATAVVAHYLLSLPDHTVRVETGRVHLVHPLPKPIGRDPEIQPLKGAPRPDY